MPVKPAQLEIYHTAIPMRSFEHAAASRCVAEAIVVRLEFSDGQSGWGETLPREYVTGETLEGVARDLAEVIWPACGSQPLGVDGSVAEIPLRDADGRWISAAACAFDLASLRRLFARTNGRPTRRLLEAADRPSPRGYIDTRVSGVLGSVDPARTAGRLRKMRWFGLKDFKLKLGLGEDVDAENLRIVRRQIGKAVSCGKATLRVDVNGGWDADSTPDRVEELRRFGVCVVEQPVYCSPVQLLALARKCSLPLMADETLKTADDARYLLQGGAQVWWNIRLSKNGGFLRSLRLARLAAEQRVPFTIGCMVGETSILSAAQRLLLQWGPVPRFVEGNYGRFLMTDDLVRRSLRFGYGGRLKALRRPQDGVDVAMDKLQQYGQLLARLPA